MDKLGRVIYKGIVACVVAVGIANVVDYFYAALHASAATSGSANFKPSVVINPTATITLSNNNASLAVTPNKSGMFAYTQTPIRVDARTNTPNDVAVNMVPSGSANTLVSGSNSIATLDTTNCATGCATTSSYFLNRWGYNVTSSVSAPSTYLPVLTTTNQVLAYNNTAANISNSTATTRYVYFGMKVDQSMAPGTYSRALNFTVTVAPDPEPEVPTMQDATASSLADLMPDTGDSTTLADSRDGKRYSVAKLADGKYWMTTNLDLTVGTTLNASDSDVPSDGYYTVPNNSFFSGTDTGFAKNTGSTDCTNTSTGCYSYYSWIAATAGGKDASGNDVTSDGSKAAYSICPKGWRLPTATTEGVARDDGGYTGGDFYKMILAVTGQSSLANGYYESTANFYNAAGPNTTANFPLSGYYRLYTLQNVGGGGVFWSATSSSDTNAYYLVLNSSNVFSASTVGRWDGRSVRCVFQPTMQDVTSSSLATLMPNTGDSTTLVDSRDGKSYTVAKLADGKYWMTTNLDLTVGTTLNASDSDVPSDGYYTVPDNSSFSEPDTGFAKNTGSTDCANTSTGCYSYYSWIAATAGGKDASGNDVTSDGGNVAYSICPKGWRLPTATTSSVYVNDYWKTGDFYALATAYGANLESNYYERAGTFYNNAGPGTTPNFPLSGSYSSGSVDSNSVGIFGVFWSASSQSSTYAHYFYLGSQVVYPAYHNRRYFGISVRCVFDQPTMQSVTSSKLATLMPNTGDTTTLEDERDGKSYTVAKLADGKYWMTSNLDLAVGTTLNASDSDVPSDGYYTIPDNSSFSDTDTGFAKNTGSTDCTIGSTGCYSYYSWIAATAGGKDTSENSITSDGSNAAYSICPKGWRLPTATTSNASPISGTNYQTGDFYQMAIHYGLTEGVRYENPDKDPKFSTLAGPGTTPNFLLSGFYDSGSVRTAGRYGHFWSATSRSDTDAYSLYFESYSLNFESFYVNSASNGDRYFGGSVHCVFGS